MSYFISLIAIFMAIFALKYFTRLKFEVLFPLVNLSVIPIMYICGLCKILVFGGYLILIACLTLFFVSLFKIIEKKDKAFIKEFFSPVVIVILTISIVQYIALFFFEVISWDEMSHWGLVVKNMFYHHNFGGGETATTMFKGYPVGISLYLYFFEIFGVTFEAGHMYMAMNLLNLSLLLPVLAKFDNYKQKIVFSSIIAFIVVLFNQKVFMSIWSDMFLSVCFAYIMIMYFCFVTDKGLSKANVISIILATFVLVSAKESGLALTIFALIIIGLDLLIIRRGVLKANKKNVIISISIVLVAILFAKISWSIYLSTIDLGGAWETSELTLKNVIKYIINPTEYQLGVTKKFFYKFWNPGTSTGNAGAVPLPYMLDFAIIALLIWYIVKKSGNKKYAISLAVGVFVTFLAYTIGLLISYIFTFSEAETSYVASFVRYMNTYVVGIILFLTSFAISLFTQKENEKMKKRYLAIICSVFLIVSIIGCPIIKNKMDKYHSNFKEYIAGIDRLNEDDRVFIINCYSTSRTTEYLFMRYTATPMETSGFKVGGSPYTGDAWHEGMNIKRTIKAIEDGGYNYLYLHNIGDEFKSRYISLFKSEIKEKTFYKIICTDGEYGFISFEV